MCLSTYGAYEFELLDRTARRVGSITFIILLILGNMYCPAKTHLESIAAPSITIGKFLYPINPRILLTNTDYINNIQSKVKIYHLLEYELSNRSSRFPTSLPGLEMNSTTSLRSRMPTGDYFGL